MTPSVTGTRTSLVVGAVHECCSAYVGVAEAITRQCDRVDMMPVKRMLSMSMADSRRSRRRRNVSVFASFAPRPRAPAHSVRHQVRLHPPPPLFERNYIPTNSSAQRDETSLVPWLCHIHQMHKRIKLHRTLRLLPLLTLFPPPLPIFIRSLGLKVPASRNKRWYGKGREEKKNHQLIVHSHGGHS